MTPGNLDTLIRREVKLLHNGQRNESSDFLVWYLINFFRLDEENAALSVCDSPNDKGIDGIVVDDINNEIYIFQTKYSPNILAAQGDNDLRNFAGSSRWFDNPDNINQLDSSFASNELKSLIKRVKIFEALSKEYEVYQVFVTNKRFDTHGTDYIKIAGDNFTPYDIDKLAKEYLYTGKSDSVIDKFTIDIESGNLISGTIDNVEYFITPIKVSDLVRLKGINDKTLFAKNVRYSLGRTRVNKEIRKTIAIANDHKKVILFHNGITLIAEKIIKGDKTIEIENYSIVNGCQSTVSFFENQDKITDDLKVLIKLIKVDKDTRISQQITYFTNNQNSISLRDLKSNEKFQQDIQTQFKTLSSNKILYNIKNGEDETGYSEVIPNDYAAQLITSFQLNAPHTTHQKSEIFTENYNTIFNKNINAYYIYVLHKMFEGIRSKMDSVEHEGVKSYKTVHFFFMYLFKLIIEKDPEGKLMISNPEAFYTKYRDKDLKDKFAKLFSVIVPDFNYLIKEQEEKSEYYDYKNEFRNAQKIKEIADKLLVDYQKSINRHPEDSLEKILSV
jgi:hypothetical protein